MEPNKAPKYTEYIKELEENRENIKLELEEHVFSNYLKFIDIFKEFKEVQSVSISCYDSCFDTIKDSLKDLLAPIKVKKIANSTTITKGSAE
jgi:hypothetical protein